MSEAFVIEGRKQLEGSVQIRGSKNAALPLIAACLLAQEPCVLENVPAIADVATLLDMVRRMGVRADWDEAQHRVLINAAHWTSSAPDEALARKLRGSILLAGALVGRMRKATLPYPGGDTIGARPLTTHWRALEALGVVIRQEDSCLVLDGKNLRGASVVMEEPSVTATENAILAAALAPGKTVISLGAFEPHVQELIKFLRAMGANIQWIEGFRIQIEGVAKLHGATHRVNADELEVSAFAVLAAATHSRIEIKGTTPEYLDAIFLQLRKMGVAYQNTESTLIIEKPAAGYKSFRIQSGLYPKLGSDHLPPFAVLATQAEGASLIHDWLYEDRLRYLSELEKMGADCTLLDPHRAFITGPTVLVGRAINSFDIRSGMTLIIAALVADGQSIISHIEHIDRGYERIEERLRMLGAEVKRVSFDDAIGVPAETKFL